MTIPRCVFACVVLGGFLTLSFSARADGLLNAIGACGEPCVISRNLGGIASEYEAAAHAVLGGARKQIIISGTCASACALFADKVRNVVCVTPRAVFYFHKATLWSAGPGSEVIRRFAPQQSPDIQAWVMARGGYPAGDRLRDMLAMPAAESHKFFRQCRA
ncbi:MAG: hypothetical protein ABI399_13000 [Bauldia sp.]